MGSTACLKGLWPFPGWEMYARVSRGSETETGEWRGGGGEIAGVRVGLARSGSAWAWSNGLCTALHCTGRREARA